MSEQVSEHMEQVEFFQRARELYEDFPDIPYLLFAIPNGGSRHPATALKMRAEGQKPGVPDIMCAIPVGAYHGMFLELKTVKKGRVSPEQKDMLARMARNGYFSVVARGCEEAFAVLRAYLYEDVPQDFTEYHEAAELGFGPSE